MDQFPMFFGRQLAGESLYAGEDEDEDEEQPGDNAAEGAESV